MTLDIRQIMEALPHRYPFLLLDRIESMEKGTKIVALKNVTINEDFFNGHFPGFPVMPGVLIVEAMAQAGGILALQDLGGELGTRKIFFMITASFTIQKTLCCKSELHGRSSPACTFLRKLPRMLKPSSSTHTKSPAALP